MRVDLEAGLKRRHLPLTYKSPSFDELEYERKKKKRKKAALLKMKTAHEKFKDAESKQSCLLEFCKTP